MLRFTAVFACAGLLGCSSERGGPESATPEEAPLAAPVAPAPVAPAPASVAFETLTFPSEDNLPITADLYAANDAKAPIIVLFHQAGWSRGEYRDIAVRLGTLGFNAMAVDARSGGGVADVTNATAQMAKQAGKKVSFVDALPDLRAALAYARASYPEAKVISWGSSYSAALVLHLAGSHPQLADATLAFAPGEYFAKLGKSKTWIRDAAKKIKTPVFVTSAKSEVSNWKAIYDAIPSTKKAKFVPATKGNHGSRALWSKFEDAPAYWQAVEAFLVTVKPAT